MFVGSADLSGVNDEPIALVFVIIATIIGSLLLTNLLIALMTTRYENVEEEAKSEVIYNRAELIYDLSDRRRLMPPPLNILVLIITFIVDLIGFPFGMCKPRWLHYSRIDSQIFFNLQGFNIWHCEKSDKWKSSRGNSTYDSRRKICKWYFYGWCCDWCRITRVVEGKGCQIGEFFIRHVMAAC